MPDEPEVVHDVEVADALAVPTPSPLAVDRGTGEVIAVDEYHGIASQPVNAEASAVLQAPVLDAEIDILPTGEVYLSQIGYRRRLNAAFGPGGWGMKPLSKPSLNVETVIVNEKAKERSTLLQEWALYGSGNFIASAYGEAEYQPSNARMTYATALESLKSNALMRCCKDLGIASECWDKRFCHAFQRDHCVQVWIEGNRKPQWRRKDSKPFYKETGVVVVKDAEPPKSDPAPSPAPTTAIGDASATPPAEQPWSGSNVTRCEFIKTMKGEYGPMDLYEIVLDGKLYTSIKKQVHMVCTAAMAKGQKVEILQQDQPNPQYPPRLNLVAVEGK